MEKGSTYFLRAALVAIVLTVVALLIFILSPALATEDDATYRLILIAIYLSVIPFFKALWQANKLLDFIDKNTAFSDLSVQALAIIKRCAITISGLYLISLPAFYAVAQAEDAPGVMMIGLIITGAALVVAVFAAVLQKLLKNVIDLKHENDLTV
jgi:hypothetical protein